MMSANPFSSRFMTTAFVAAAIAAFGLSVRAQDNGSHQTPYVDDWSHHHVIFSNPGTKEDAVKNGRLEHWQRVTNDPRYQLQQLKRSHSNRQVVDDRDADHDGRGEHHKPGSGGGSTNVAGIEKDWSTPLGSGAGTISVSCSTPASGTVTGSSQFTLDGQIFSASAPTSATGSITVAPAYCFAPGAGVTVHGVPITTNATDTSATETFASNPSAGETLTINGATYDFQSSSGSCVTGQKCVSRTGGTSGSVTALAAAVGGACFNSPSPSCGADLNVTATSSGSIVTITQKCAGAANTFALTGDGTKVTASTVALGSSGSTGGSNFALPNPALNTTVATTMASAILAQTATDLVNVAAASNVVNLTASTAGTTGNTLALALDGASTGLTLSGPTLTTGTNGTADANHFVYFSGATYYTAAQMAASIATAVNANPTTGPTISASQSGDSVVFSNSNTSTSYPVTVSSFTGLNGGTGFTISAATGPAATVQPNAFPAKYGPSLTAASCANDYVVYPTGQLGGASAANIIAYNNLYTTGCSSGSVPSVNWAFNTGSGYSVTTSPIIAADQNANPDGTKVAFIQSNGTLSSLVVVKWAASSGTLAAPVAPTTGAPITTCTAPCMVVTNLTNNDTYSAPYYDPFTDTVYVGDDSGTLEMFTGVFRGATVTNTVQALGQAYPLASPVYDSNSGCVFVGDTQGYLYRASSGNSGSVCTGAFGSSITTSEILGNGSANEGIFDGVLFDSTTQHLYAFITASAALSATGTCAANSNCVAEFATNFGAGLAPAVVQSVGTGGAGYNLYAGTFDNVYYSSPTSSGYLYSIGDTGATTGAILYQIPVTSGAMGTPINALGTTLLTGSGTYPWPSPLTEFCNNGLSACTASSSATTAGQDYVFFSVNQSAVGGGVGGCTNAAGNGCILSYNVKTPTSVALSGTGQNFWTPTSFGCWATSGIVVDNSVPVGTTIGASQIYFVNLNGAAAGGASGPASANCAAGTSPTLAGIQASQNNP